MDGWTGYIITHEIYFAMLDYMPMIIALVTFNIFHPGMYLTPDLLKAKDESVDVVADLKSVDDGSPKAIEIVCKPVAENTGEETDVVASGQPTGAVVKIVDSA